VFPGSALRACLTVGKRFRVSPPSRTPSGLGYSAINGSPKFPPSQPGRCACACAIAPAHTHPPGIPLRGSRGRRAPTGAPVWRGSDRPVRRGAPVCHSLLVWERHRRAEQVRSPPPWFPPWNPPSEAPPLWAELAWGGTHPGGSKPASFPLQARPFGERYARGIPRAYLSPAGCPAHSVPQQPPRPPGSGGGSGQRPAPAVAGALPLRGMTLYWYRKRWACVSASARARGPARPGPHPPGDLRPTGEPAPMGRRLSPFGRQPPRLKI